MTALFVNLLVRGAILCVLTAMALSLLRRSAAAYRHLICAIALCGMMVLPVIPRLLPAIPLPVGSVAFPPPESHIYHPPGEMRPEPVWPRAANPVVRRAESPVVQKPIASQLPSILRLSVPAARIHLEAALPIVWALVAALLLLRLSAALFRLRKLALGCERMMQGNANVLLSKEVDTPMTWGLFRPIVLIPADVISCEPSVCDSVLRHEQAHIARRDWVWHLLAEIICALYWFQPGCWWLRRRMRLESERACDDCVLLSGIHGADYAAHLLVILKAGAASAFAPGMTGCGEMESRLKHILDASRPRHSQSFRILLTALLGVALLPVAALRVTAKSVQPPLTAETDSQRNVPLMKDLFAASELSASGPTERTQPASDPAARDLRHRMPAPAVLRSSDPSRAGTAPDVPHATELKSIAYADIIWGTPIQGLEPGFLLTTPGFPNNNRVPFNSQVTYKVLVRNATARERLFEVQCITTDDQDIPYLIPSDDSSDALRRRLIPRKYRATGASSPLDGLLPGFTVKLAPGEAVVVPGEFGLYVGGAQKPAFPRIEKINEGMNWIVQPITIHSLSSPDDIAAEGAKFDLSVLDRRGELSRKPGMEVPARSGGITLYAKIQLEVGTLNAAAVQSAQAAVWGKVDKGLQCGIRPLTNKRTFLVGDTMEAELLYRNAGKASITVAMPYVHDLYPIVRNAGGQEVLCNSGARMMLLPGFQTLLPGEVRSLGVERVKLVPAGAPSPTGIEGPWHVTLAPGDYRLSGFGGVGDPDPESGGVGFRVVADLPALKDKSGQ